MHKYRLFEKTSAPSKNHGASMNGKSPSSPPPSPADDPLDRLDRIRAELRSVTDEDEDTGNVHIPSDAPPRAKVILGFASGLTPNGRLIIGLAFIIALTLLLLKGVKLL